LFCSALRLLPRGQNLTLLQFVKRRAIAPVGSCDSCARSKKVHYVEPGEALILEFVEERRNFICNKSRMPRGDLCALNVGLLKANPEGVNPRESLYSVVETMVHHPHQRNFVFENSANLFEARLPLIGGATYVESPSKLSVRVIVPDFREPIPIAVVFRCGIRQTELVPVRMKDNVDSFVSAHSPGKSNHSLLTID